MNNKLLFIFIFFSFLFSNITAQDSLAIKNDIASKYLSKTDTTKKKKSLKNYFKKDYPSPKKAVLLAIIPGMGQIYTKKYWKLPLVYGALGGVIYSIGFNTRNYNRTLQSLEAKANNTPELDPFPNTPENAVRSRRNSFDKNRQLSWIGLFGFYLISAGDAFVDAHLKTFNVDDDISFRPVLQTDFNNQPILGLGLTIIISK